MPSTVTPKPGGFRRPAAGIAGDDVCVFFRKDHRCVLDDKMVVIDIGDDIIDEDHNKNRSLIDDR